MPEGASESAAPPVLAAGAVWPGISMSSSGIPCFLSIRKYHATKPPAIMSASKIQAAFEDFSGRPAAAPA
jgi:hypothetical protein